MRRQIVAVAVAVAAVSAGAAPAGATTPYRLSAYCRTVDGVRVVVVQSHGRPAQADPVVAVFRGVNDHGGVYRTARPNHWYVFRSARRQLVTAYWTHTDPPSGIGLVDGSVTVTC